MIKLTNANSRVHMEKRALHIIMMNKNAFKIDEIVQEFRNQCDESITDDQIFEAVINALDYCLSTGDVDIYDEFSYMVNPIQQILYEEKQNVNSGVSV